jgi:hypothetical protein
MLPTSLLDVVTAHQNLVSANFALWLCRRNDVGVKKADAGSCGNGNRNCSAAADSRIFNRDFGVKGN